MEIENGILRSGICDALSALRLGVKPTGNGKRQNYEHKVYTRMTNTLFDSGTDKVERYDRVCETWILTRRYVLWYGRSKALGYSMYPQTWS